MSAVELQRVTKSFGATLVIKDVSLSIQAGEFVSLLGPSGCGKTTLLRMIAGLESATSGSVVIGGRDSTRLPPEQRDIAMVFQSYALLPHLTARENIGFPLRMRRLGTAAEQRRRVDEVLATVQLEHLADRKPRELSGGQQQRVAIARAVVSRPQVLLLDEPLSNLDARLRENMQEELIQLHRRTGLTTVFVTHDQEEALSLSDRVILLNEGRIEQEGRPAEIYGSPATRFVASFLGSTNLVDVVVETISGRAQARLSPDTILALRDVPVTGPATLMVRQEDVQVVSTSEPSSFLAEIETRIFLGSRVRYVLRVGGHKLRSLTSAERSFGTGEMVGVRIAAEAVRILER
jgi:putative spermidine/putrescine transport system ATP-binding protein